MKHLIPVTVILLTLIYFTTTLAQQIDAGSMVELQGRGQVCRFLGGECRHRNRPCKDGYEKSPPGRPYCTKKRKSCCYPPQVGSLKQDIFAGPYNNHWGVYPCSRISGLYVNTSLSECKEMCITEEGCNAINVIEHYNECWLSSCPWPVPLPQLNDPHVQGYAIAKATCGTASKCGIKGGFCIPESEECNGKIITGDDYCHSAYTERSCKCCFTPTVYMRDIENTIAYALRNRVIYSRTNPLKPYDPKENVFMNLNSSMLVAVSNFAQVLVKHLPLSLYLETFLTGLDKYLNEIIESGHNITGADLLGNYSQIDGDLPYSREWIGCRNVDNIQQHRIERFRSYPCGVWNTFHAITVDLFRNQTDSGTILSTLYGMVNYFPWCPDCRRHFIKMYRTLNATDMNTPYEVTMWLWRAHNKVSVRVTDGFDGPSNKSWKIQDCTPYTPAIISPLTTLLSECKFKCKMLEKDCKYIEVPGPESNDVSTCSYCKPQSGTAEFTIYPNLQRYSLNTAPENPGRRKSLFPEYNLCEDCWILSDKNNSNIYDFKTITNDAMVLSYLRELYKRDAILPKRLS